MTGFLGSSAFCVVSCLVVLVSDRLCTLLLWPCAGTLALGLSDGGCAWFCASALVPPSSRSAPAIDARRCMRAVLLPGGEIPHPALASTTPIAPGNGQDGATRETASPVRAALPK